MLYPAIRPLLFLLDPESAHQRTLSLLDTLTSNPLTRSLVAAPLPHQRQPIDCMGLSFPGRIGLAAGLDKNGDHIDALGALGFGFMEIGTITPRPQAGNPQPRLFRLPADEALINRMGFNNLGVDHLVQNASARRFSGILGINIGKNADTPNENAHEDYLTCLDKVYATADYITINISSPNTRNLREIQHGDLLRLLLETLKTRQLSLQARHGAYRPLAVKIAPDLDADQIEEIADAVLEFEIDGVIATNTSLSRDTLSQSAESRKLAKEQGGLSGKPIASASTEVIRQLGTRLAGRVPIIGAGGIHDIASAKDKLDAGATLLQVYTALIYQGPALVKRLNQAL